MSRILFCLTALALGSCTFPPPISSRFVEVHLSHGGDFVITRRTFLTQTLTTRSECWFNFGWNRPPEGIRVNERLCEQVDAEARSFRGVPLNEVADAVEEAVIREYSVTKAELANFGGSPFRWVNENGGFSAAAVQGRRRAAKAR